MVSTLFAAGVQVALSREDDRNVVWLAGEHDIATESELAKSLATAIAADDQDVVVDLSGVTFMSAATIGQLIRGRNFLQERSRDLTLRDPSPFAARILELCDLRSLIGSGAST